MKDDLNRGHDARARLADLRPDLIDEALAAACAAEIGLAIPPECVPGVVANLRLLARHAALLDTDAR